MSPSLDLVRAALRVKSVGLGNLHADPAKRAWLPEDTSLHRYDERFNLPRDGQRMCDHPWQRLVVNWGGQITPCRYDPNGEYELGNASGGNRYRVEW